MAQLAVDPSRVRRSPVHVKDLPPPPYEFYDAHTISVPFVVDPCVAVPFARTHSLGATRPEHPRPQLTQSRRTGPNLSIPHLREALHSLESKMATLLSERELLESRLEQAVRLQSPIQRLPEELLSTIFEIGVLYEDEEDSLTLANMMLVCRYWRDVAVDTPGLWSRIMTGTHHSIERARLKLERSKNVPLDIWVDFSPPMEYGSVRTETLMHAMDLLRPSISRWRSFHLTVPNRPQTHAVLSRCKERAPLLEVLSVRVCHSMQEDHYSTPPLPLFEGRTPRLRSSSFTSFNFNWDMALVSRLRVLKLGGYWNGLSPSVDVILGILRACPQLEELALRNMSDVDPRTCAQAEADPSDHDDSSERFVRLADSRTVQLPNLRKASFYYCGNMRARTVLGLLAFPALEEIELCFLDNVSSIIEQLRRQSLTRLPLHRLRIESSYFGEMRLFRLLRRLPALTALEFVDVDDVSSNLLKNLSTPPMSQTWICPRLTTLGLEGCTSLDWESIRSCVESRLPAQARAFPRQSTASTSPVLAPSLSSTSSSTTRATSSASAFAAQAHILSRIPAAPSASGVAMPPQRLESINLSRCHQISKEMLQWLRMYVAEVKYETTRGVWGEVPS